MKINFNKKNTVLAYQAICVSILGITLNPNSSEAAVIRIPQTAFTPEASLITFDEFPVNTVNPVYTPEDYNGNVFSDPNVSFGGFFQGQDLGEVIDCPLGGAITSCIVGEPSADLSLDSDAPDVVIVDNEVNPESPFLSGEPIFNGAISVLFDRDIAGVGLDAAFFNTIGGMAITAFSRDGSTIGSVANESLGVEFLGLTTADNSNSIAGLQFDLVGSEPEGFAIDNLRFGTVDEIVTSSTSVPEPVATFGLIAIGIVGINSLKRKK